MEEVLAGIIKDLDLGKGVSEAVEDEGLEVQKLGLVSLGQLKGKNKGSLKLEKQGTDQGIGAVSTDCKIDLEGGVDKEGCKPLKSSIITQKRNRNEK